jgi:hypothetical protein
VAGRKSFKAMYVAGWHDPEHGNEPTYRKGANVIGFQHSPDWYRQPIHRGGMRARLLRRHGIETCLFVIGVYDQIQQFTAGKPRPQRGWCLGPTGGPLSPSELAQMLVLQLREASRSAHDAQNAEKLLSAIDILLSAKWLVWAAYKPSGDAPTVPGTTSYRNSASASTGASATQLSAHSGSTSAKASASAKAKGTLSAEGWAAHAPNAGTAGSDSGAAIPPELAISELLASVECDASFRSAVGRLSRSDDSVLPKVRRVVAAANRKRPTNPGGWVRVALLNVGVCP